MIERKELSEVKTSTTKSGVKVDYVLMTFILDGVKVEAEICLDRSFETKYVQKSGDLYSGNGSSDGMRDGFDRGTITHTIKGESVRTLIYNRRAIYGNAQISAWESENKISLLDLFQEQ